MSAPEPRLDGSAAGMVAAAGLLSSLFDSLFGGGGDDGRPGSRAAFSMASICLDCCSNVSSVSQLISGLVSIDRLGAIAGPFNAIASVGRALPPAAGLPVSVTKASSAPSVRLTPAVALRSAPGIGMANSSKRA